MLKDTPWGVGENFSLLFSFLLLLPQNPKRKMGLSPAFSAPAHFVSPLSPFQFRFERPPLCLPEIISPPPPSPPLFPPQKKHVLQSTATAAVKKRMGCLPPLLPTSNARSFPKVTTFLGWKRLYRHRRKIGSFYLPSGQVMVPVVYVGVGGECTFRQPK